MYRFGLQLKNCKAVVESLLPVLHYYWSNRCNLGNFRSVPPPLPCVQTNQTNDIIKVPSSGNDESSGGDHRQRLLRRVGGGAGVGYENEEQIETMAEAGMLLEKARS